MAETIGNLIIALEANTAKLDAQIKQSKSHFTSFRSTVDSVKSALAGLAVFAGLKEIGDIVAEDQKTFALLQSQVKATGEAAGFSAEQLAKMADQIQASTTYDDDAVRNVESQMLAFTNITGAQFKRTLQVVLDFATVTGRDASEAVRTLGQAINNPISSMGRLTQAGISLDQATKEQIKSMQESGNLIGAQNLLLSMLQKSYGGAAVAARDTFGGAMTGLKNSFEDLFKGGPGSFQGATDSINDLAKTLEDPKIKQGMDGLISGFATAVKWGGELAGAIVRITQGLGEFSAQLYAGAGSTNPLDISKERLASFQSQAAQIKHALSMGDTVDILGLSPEKAKAKLALIENEIKEAQSAIQYESTHHDERKAAPLMKTHIALAGSTDQLAGATDKATGSLAKMLDQLKQENATFGQSKAAVLEYRLTVGDLAKTVKEAGAAGQAMKEALILNQGQLDIREQMKSINAQGPLKPLADNMKKTTDQMSQYAISAARNIQSILGDGLYNALHGKFTNIWQSFADMLERMIAQAASSKILDSVFGNGNSGSGQSAIGSFFSGLFSNTGQGHAIGGPAAAGQPIPVGEKGPELFIPTTNGTVIPNESLRGGGNYTSHFYVNAQGADGISAARLIQWSNEMRRAWLTDMQRFNQRGTVPLV